MDGFILLSGGTALFVLLIFTWIKLEERGEIGKKA